MILMQVILLISLIFVAVYTLIRRHTYAGKAWQKIMLISLFLMSFLAVLFPELVNMVAHLFGVGRGADMLLYIMVMVFTFYALNSYLKQQEQRDIIYRLARKIALIEAQKKK